MRKYSLNSVTELLPWTVAQLIATYLNHSLESPCEFWIEMNCGLPPSFLINSFSFLHSLASYLHLLAITLSPSILRQDLLVESGSAAGLWCRLEFPDSGRSQAKCGQHLFRISQKDVLEDFGKDPSLYDSPHLCPNLTPLCSLLSSNAKVDHHTKPRKENGYSCCLVLGSSQVSTETRVLYPKRVLGPQAVCPSAT